MPSAFVQWMQQHQRPISYVDDTDRLGQARQRLGIKVSAPPVEPPPAQVASTPPSLDDGMVINGRDVGRYREVPYADIIQEAGSKFGVDPALLTAMMRQESNFDPNATSHAGAAGLLQLMPGTASDMGVSNPYDPYDNIMGGAKYVKWLTDYTGGDTNDILRAYNSGPGTWKRGGYPAETQTYVQNVLRYYNQYR